MRRVLAVVGALVMIGVALVVRGRIDDGTDEGSDPGGGEILVVCPQVLASGCSAWDAARDDLTVRVEPISATYDAIATGTLDADAWLAPKPWVDAAVAASRDGNGTRLGEPSEAVLRSAVVIAVDSARADALAAACGGEVGWRCLGELAETSVEGIPRVEVGVSDPEGAAGLGVLGAAATGWFGGTDFAWNDFDSAFDAWLQGLAANASVIAANPRNPVDRLLTERGQFTVVAATDAEAFIARDDDRATLIYPQPVSTVDIVVVARDGIDADDLTARGIDELRAALPRWASPQDLSGPANQPNGGVLLALLERWREAAR